MRELDVCSTTVKGFSTGDAWRQTFLNERRAKLTAELSGASGDRKAAIEAALKVKTKNTKNE